MPITIKEIDEKISQLKLQKRELEENDIQSFKISAKKNVGRCFIIGDRYCKIINVPQEEQTKTGTNFNRYQYPAIFLTNGLVPFEEDTVFSGIWGDGNSRLVKAIEISNEEFQSEFNKRISKFKFFVKDVS